MSPGLGINDPLKCCSDNFKHITYMKVDGGKNISMYLCSPIKGTQVLKSKKSTGQICDIDFQ